MGTTRMNATDRRELVLAAATKAFARGGYTGTSTDAVAKEAGVSQPYVVRMFGTKVELFQAVFAKTVDAIAEVFETELDGIPDFDPLDEAHWERLGQAYGELFQDRDLLMVLLHGFVQGNDQAIGAQAREAMSRIYTLLREGTGADPELVRDFVAKGMLINILIAMGAPEHAHAGSPLGELSVCSFGEKLSNMRLVQP